MDFFIQKNSTLPKLKCKFYISDETNYESFSNLIKTANATFSLKDVSNNSYKIANKPATIESKFIGDNEFSDLYEYFLVYNFDAHNTNKTGTFIGEFNITFNSNPCDNLIVPIKENLYIHIQDSFTN